MVVDMTKYPNTNIPLTSNAGWYPYRVSWSTSSSPDAMKIHTAPLDQDVQEEPKHGLFFVTFNNSKKRGRGKPLQSHDAWGACFPETGHVWLDTPHLPVHDFLSMRQMREYLGKLGVYRVVWEKESKSDE